MNQIVGYTPYKLCLAKKVGRYDVICTRHEHKRGEHKGFDAEGELHVWMFDARVPA